MFLTCWGCYNYINILKHDKSKKKLKCLSVIFIFLNNEPKNI